MRKIPLYIIANSVVSSNEISGGDRIFIELGKRINQNWDLNIMTPDVGRKLCIKYGVIAKYLIVPCSYSWETKRSGPLGLARVFIRRIIMALPLIAGIKDRSIIYSSSDLMTDTIPAFFTKLRNRRCKWIAGLHLIAPSPWKGYKKVYAKGFSTPKLGGVFYYLSQKLSLFLMSKKADLILVMNDLDKAVLLKKNFHSDKILVRSGGVDIQEFSSVNNVNKKYDASFVGRFHPQKGIFDLVKIWKHVCYAKQNAKLVIVGAGERKLESELRNKIIDERLRQNILLVGFLDEEEKIRVLKSSRVFLFPSTYESWGLAACEAMACGLPVIAYDLPIYNKIFPNGMIRTPIGDVEKFANNILNLLDNEQLYDRISKEAKTQALEYDWSKVIPKQLEIFEALFSSN